jgi:thiamine monophosphate synthase
VREAIGNFPLVAIGGITLSNLHEVFKAGADSAAIISGLFSDTDRIDENFKSLSSR